MNSRMANRTLALASSHAELLRRAEKQTRARGPSGLRAAKVAFSKLSKPDQLTLLEELVELRSAELCRAYRNVIDVSIGYKKQKDKRTGNYRIGRTPCITFWVKRKWSTNTEADPNELLPTHLFIYTRIARKRQLCAVKTDVVDAREYAKVSPQSKQIVVRPSRNPRSHAVTGVVTCAVKKTGSSSQLYALSCRHVFGITNSKGPSFFFAEVRIRKNNGLVGTTIGLRGDLKHNLKFSFDAQACQIDDFPDRLWEALDNIVLSGFARNNPQVPNWYWIHVADRDPVKARRVAPVPRSNFPLRYKNIGVVVHEQVIEGLAATKRGDSGAPCTSRADGGVLLGMHFAGPEQPSTGSLVEGPVFMIPAWHLLDRSRYQRGSSKKLWKLVGGP